MKRSALRKRALVVSAIAEYGRALMSPSICAATPKLDELSTWRASS